MSDFTHATALAVVGTPITNGPIYHREMLQGSDEWVAIRCGMLTASEMRLVISPPPKPETRTKKDGSPYKEREWNPVADDEKCRAHLYELLSQRITRYVEPQYFTDAMLRGKTDEVLARALYSEKYAPVETCGFITNNRWGFTLGYSPDGLVGDAGLIECKSHRQGIQMKTLATLEVPSEYVMQIQTGLLVSEREWLDFISYCGGLHMLVLRVHSDPIIQNAVVEASGEFERRLAEHLARYGLLLADKTARLLETERTVEMDIMV